MLYEKNKIENLISLLKTSINEMYQVFTNDILILDYDTRATLIGINFKELIKLSREDIYVNYKFKSEEYHKNDHIIFDESIFLLRITISEKTLDSKKMVMLLVFTEEAEIESDEKQGILEKLKLFTNQSGEHQFDIGIHCGLRANVANLTYCIDGGIVLF